MGTIESGGFVGWKNGDDKIGDSRDRSAERELAGTSGEGLAAD